MLKKKIMVVGVGKFGLRLAEKLVAQNAEVVAIDHDIEQLKQVQGSATLAISLDCTDPEAFKELDLPMKELDAAIVTIGESMEGSILATLILKEMGVPEVISRATSIAHKLALEKVGADSVVFPEYDRADRLAQAVMGRQVVDYIEISSNLGMATVHATDMLIGKSLLELDFKNRYGGMVLAIKRDRIRASADQELSEAGSGTRFREVIELPDAGERIRAGDLLVVVGPQDKLTEVFDQES